MLPKPVVSSPSPQFGSKGVVVVTGAFLGGFTVGRFVEVGGETLAAGLAPSVDWFMVRQISIGVTTQVFYERLHDFDGRDSDERVTVISAAPRLGVDIPFSREVSIYPQVAFGLESVTRRERFQTNPNFPIQGMTTQEASRVGPWTALSLPLLFHLRPHAFVGFGPYIRHSFADTRGDSSWKVEPSTRAGAQLVIGGWTGGQARAGDLEQPVSWRYDSHRRFGERRQIVIGADTNASVSASFDPRGGGVRLTRAEVAPTFDRFVRDDISVGIAIGAVYENVDYDAIVESEAFGIAAAPRIGYAIRLSDELTLYPRLHAGYAYAEVVTRSLAGAPPRTVRSKAEVHRLISGLYVPLLYHFASRAFIGLGPFVEQDLAAKAAPRSTMVGVRLTLGVWR